MAHFPGAIKDRHRRRMQLREEAQRECGGRDLNPRTTKDGILSPAPLARLDYPRKWSFIW